MEEFSKQKKQKTIKMWSFISEINQKINFEIKRLK